MRRGEGQLVLKKPSLALRARQELEALTRLAALGTLSRGAREREGELAPRVKLLVDLAEAIAVDVGVDLRRRDVGVAQQVLHDAQVGAA